MGYIYTLYSSLHSCWLGSIGTGEIILIVKALARTLSSDEVATFDLVLNT